MSTTLPELDQHTLEIQQETRVRASIDLTFAALLEQLGAAFDKPDGTPMPMKLEAWPGGRWFRDLGDGNGHYWATVQAIKRPSLLEFCGPLMMSHPVANNVQYRLHEENGETVISLRHSGFGKVSDDHRQGMPHGWSHIGQKARERAENALTKSRK